uniref:Germinal-centre associated nuclear protein MCM3AP domain-containing protein n=1 Tax=Monodelphis domestica TaxID=13616 RepID=A0A5F8HC11_MONDO
MAYTASSQRPTFFPLYDLVRMLLFRDCAEAEDFVSFYGLHVSDGWVELNRTAFRESERVCKPTRSALIRQKRSVSVGEVINGGPLPSFVRHVPVGSFNAESVYVGESLQPRAACRTQKPAQDLATAPAQGKSARSMGTSVPPVHPERMPALPPLCPQSAPTPQPQPRPEPPGALHPLGMSPHSSGAPAPAPSPFRVVQTVLPIQRNGAAFSERDAGGALPERDGVVREESRATRGAEAASRGPAFGSAAEARRVPEELCASLLALFVEEEISGAAQDVFREFRCFHKCLWQWKKMVLAQKKWKRHVRAFPPAPCYVDQAERLKALLPSAECPATRESLSRGVLNLGHAGRLGISCTRLNWIRTEMIHQMKVQYFYQNLLSKAVWSPLDWPSLLSEHLSFQHGPVFWKLVLVLPRDQGDRLDEPGRTLAEWVKVKFTGSEGTTSDRAPNKVQTLSVFSFPSKEGNCRSRIHGSVQVGPVPCCPLASFPGAFRGSSLVWHAPEASFPGHQGQSDAGLKAVCAQLCGSTSVGNIPTPPVLQGCLGPG